MKSLFKTVLVSAILLMVPMMLFSQDVKREETVFMTGAMWGPPSNWNPLTYWSMVPGVVGLVYETLYTYNPVTDKFLPLLAESGKWVKKDTFEVKLKKGIKWQDGKDFTAADVVFTFKLGQKFKGVYYSNMWYSATTPMLKDVTAPDAYTVNFVLSDTRYHNLKYQLYQIAILPKHVLDGKTEDELLKSPNANPVGTGAYKHEVNTEDRDFFIRHDGWWGAAVYKKLPEPKRVCVVKVPSNNVAMGMAIKGELDVCNNFLPGAPSIKKNYGMATFYDDVPFMWPENTAGVYLNTKKEPLNDPKFRRAMAFAINSKLITERVYESVVTVAHPTGLLPIQSWMDLVDKSVVAKLGFKYDPAAAKKMLADAGYKDVNGDKFVETKSGKPFKLSVICPSGWTDWMESIKIIAENCRAAGINVEAQFPDYPVYWDAMQAGTFDIVLNNFNLNGTLTPYTYWSYIGSDDIKGEKAQNGNWGRYDNPKLFKLITDFDRTNPETDAKGLKALASQIEEILLQDMPFIPLWYNGAWFLGSQSYWTNYPNDKNQIGEPLSWHGRLQMGGFDMILNLKSTVKK